ncbi:MAG: MlaD family protein [Burkholderiaceae bacterium]|jgi:phospholipid/cholesterol/gamma-HCH transport system substrate-binding protein|nr:MlaD family protein [Burkholderiaceae bacterium]
MEAEAKYAYVGAAVMALVVALVVSVVWLKRTGAERDFARFTIYFEQQALDGLAVGSAVNMRGISIGRVLDFQLSIDRLNRARVDIRVDRRAPVRENTSAVITRNFVTGIAQIRLVTPEEAGPPLTALRPGERFPVIAEGRSDVAEITGRVTELGDMAGETMQKLNQFFTAENRAAAAATLANLRDLSIELKRQLVGLEATIAEAGAAAREFRRTAATVSAATERIGGGASVALEDTRLLIGDLRQATGETRQAMAQATATLAAVQEQAAGAARRFDASAAHIDDQLLAAVGDLRAGLEAAQRSLDRLSDPRAALLGPNRSQLGPGEKLP